MEKSELTRPTGKSRMYRTHYDSNNVQNVLNSNTRASLPQSTNKRAPYISHLDSYQIHNLLNPPRGIRDEMIRRGITPQDHHKANVAAIAMKSAKLHMIRNGTWVDLPDAKTTSVKNSRNGFFGGAERCETPDNTSVTTASTQQSKGKKNPPRIDFMTRNKDELATALANGKRKLNATNTTEPKTTHENYGKIPAYLSRRKLELEQDRERRVQEQRDKRLPPGLVLMRNEERLEVLKTLESNKQKLENKLSAMLLVLEIPTQIRAKAEIDEQLKEVEDSIKRFSRPKVYIRYDS